MMWMAMALWGCAGAPQDAALRQEVVDLREEVASLEERLERLEATRSARPALTPDLGGLRTRTPSLAGQLVREDAEGSYTLDPRLLTGGGLADSARLIPHRREGEPEGVRLGGVPRDSVASAAGLRNGDLLLSIAGQPTTDADAFTVFAESRPTGTVEVELLRRDEPMTLSWTIGPVGD